MPRAINTIPLRILMFYLGTLSVLMMVTPWPAIPTENSPFVGLFALMGFAGAASLVNFVVVSSALSSTNSGIYSTSRMLYGLSWHQDAAALFGRLSSRGVPANALLLAALLLLSGAVLLAVGGSMMQAFQLVGSVASLLFIYVWTIILICYTVFRKRRPQAHDASTFKMPGGAFMPYVVMAFFTFILVTLTGQPEMRFSLYVLPFWFALLAAAYFGNVRRKPGHIERRAKHGAKVLSEKEAATRYVASKR
jgi:D-serine/D-alanine/glycine transporter